MSLKPEKGGKSMILTIMLALVGAFLGYGLSVDLSDWRHFPTASYAFVAFWTLFGGVAGWRVGVWLSWRFWNADN
jgi:uncharacterized membrane protein YeaQ/YmgE (transglycosylase-associated protein family)